MNERHEEYMKRRMREENQLQDLAHDSKYIYESPDNGKTVYQRNLGSTKRNRIVKSCPEEQKIYDLLDVKVAPQQSSDGYKAFTIDVSYDKSLVQPVKIDYKYNEDTLIKEFKAYIDSTYSEHYSKDKFQATEFIMDGGHGTGFCIGNVLKYAQRYGKKGTREDARKDLMKVLHYALMQLYVHDSDI